jgi:hypothetical protein
MAFLNYFKGSKADPEVQTDVEISDTSSGPEVIHDGNLAYTRAKAGNGSKAAYQEAVGAPVETDSPLGYEVGWFTVIFVNINMLIGTGIFSLRKFEKNQILHVMNYASNLRSCEYSPPNWVYRPIPDLLVHWISHGRKWNQSILGICQLFPQPEWQRSSIS